MVLLILVISNMKKMYIKKISFDDKTREIVKLEAENSDGSQISYTRPIKTLDKEEMARILISETDTLWEDISDDGDGDYDKGTIILTKDGEKVVDIISKLIENAD
jgi:predicted metalloprotease